MLVQFLGHHFSQALEGGELPDKSGGSFFLSQRAWSHCHNPSDNQDSLAVSLCPRGCGVMVEFAGLAGLAGVKCGQVCCVLSRAWLP